MPNSSTGSRRCMSVVKQIGCDYSFEYHGHTVTVSPEDDPLDALSGIFVSMGRGARSREGLWSKHPVKYGLSARLVSNNYHWGVEIPALQTVSNKPPHPLK